MLHALFAAACHGLLGTSPPALPVFDPLTAQRSSSVGSAIEVFNVLCCEYMWCFLASAVKLNKEFGL